MKKILCFLLTGLFFLSSCQEENLDSSAQNEQNTERQQVIWLIKTPDGSVPTKAVGLKEKYWNPGDTIRVKFLNTVSTANQEKIKDYADLWLVHADLNFQYVDASADADVKIGFGTEDERWISWSTIGTDCKAIPQDQPSLTYFWWEDDPEALIKSEILKGIGLVIGLGFEHQNPNSGVIFKPTADITGEYNLSEEEAEVFKTIYSSDQTNYTEYDKSSVMTVSIGRTMVSRPTMATSYNSELSENDKAFVSQLYPTALMTATAIYSARFFIGAGDFVAVPGPHRSRVVDWGDGTRDSLLWDEPIYEHRYKDYKKYVIRFYGHDTSYQMVYFHSGNIQSVDFSKNQGMKSFYCCGSGLKEVDASKNPKLQLIYVYENDYLHTVKVSNCDSLHTLVVNDCPVASLDVTKCNNLQKLYIQRIPIPSIDLSSSSKLVQLFCDGNALQSVDISKCDSLNIVYAVNCLQFRRITVGSNPELRALRFMGTNQLGGPDNILLMLPPRSSPKPTVYVKDLNYSYDAVDNWKKEYERKGWYIYFDTYTRSATPYAATLPLPRTPMPPR